MNNQLRTRLAARKLLTQPLDVALADRIFSESLIVGLKPWHSVLNIELTSDNVPTTGKAIYRMFVLAQADIEPFKVYNGANDADNLFFAPETNLLYRTLHDIDHALHYRQGLGTTSEASELYLNGLMAKRAYKYAKVVGYTTMQAIMTFLTVYHDNVGQVKYYFVNHDFCENQKELTHGYLKECKGMQYLSSGMVTSAKQHMIKLLMDCKVDTSDL